MRRVLLPALVLVLSSSAFAQSEIPGAKPDVVDLPEAKPDLAGPVHSSGPIPDAEPGLLGKYVNLAFGVAMTAGGNVWTHPDIGGSSLAQAADAADVGFSHLRGGAGAGAGIQVVARFIRFIELEMDLLYEWDTLYEEITDYSNYGAVKKRGTATTHNLRIPLLVKGVLPLKGVRLALGLGPEFVVPLASKAETTTLSAPVGVKAGDYLTLRTKTSTMLTMSLDIVPELGYHLLLPIQLRAAWNGTQPAGYLDRVDVNAGTGSASVLAQNTWDFRLLVGLAYEL